MTDATPSTIVSSVVLVSFLWGILIVYFVASFVGMEIFNDVSTIMMVVFLVLIIIITLLT
jgi:hypothetical protein